MTHVWSKQYQALYDRTYRVLYDAGINEELAEQLAAERKLAAAISSCDRRDIQLQRKRGHSADTALFDSSDG